MLKLRYLFAVTLLTAVGTAAKAAPVDFQVVVIDPPPSNLIHPITSDSFTFMFSPCVSPGQVPNGTSYVGCFTGENATGQTLTSLQLLIPTITNGVNTCPSSSGLGLDIFPVVSCTVSANGYTYNFSGGNIPTSNGHSPDDAEFNRDSVFTIAEAGIDPSAFPEVTANFNPVPEPSSLMLLSTGLLGGGLLFGDWRRRILARSSE